MTSLGNQLSASHSCELTSLGNQLSASHSCDLTSLGNQLSASHSCDLTSLGNQLSASHSCDLTSLGNQLSASHSCELTSLGNQLSASHSCDLTSLGNQLSASHSCDLTSLGNQLSASQENVHAGKSLSLANDALDRFKLLHLHKRAVDVPPYLNRFCNEARSCDVMQCKSHGFCLRKKSNFPQGGKKLGLPICSTCLVYNFEVSCLVARGRWCCSYLTQFFKGPKQTKLKDKKA